MSEFNSDDLLIVPLQHSVKSLFQENKYSCVSVGRHKFIVFGDDGLRQTAAV